MVPIQANEGILRHIATMNQPGREVGITIVAMLGTLAAARPLAPLSLGASAARDSKDSLRVGLEATIE